MYARSLPERGEGGAVAEGVKDLAPAGVFVRRIVLTNFRNYISSRVELPENAHRIVLTGANGAGKTNLLEAVSFLAPGKGIRNARFSDVTGKMRQITSFRFLGLLRRLLKTATMKLKSEPVSAQSGQRTNGAVS